MNYLSIIEWLMNISDSIGIVGAIPGVAVVLGVPRAAYYTLKIILMLKDDWPRTTAAPRTRAGRTREGANPLLRRFAAIVHRLRPGAVTRSPQALTAPLTTSTTGSTPPSLLRARRRSAGHRARRAHQRRMRLAA